MSKYIIFMFLVETLAVSVSQNGPDICQSIKNTSGLFCTCMEEKQFKKMCFMTKSQEPLNKEWKNLKQELTLRNIAILDLKGKDDFHTKLLIISASLNAITFIVIVRIFVTRAYLKSNKAKHTTTVSTKVQAPNSMYTVLTVTSDECHTHF